MRRPDKDGRGSLKIAFSRARKTAYYSMDIRLKRNEWDAEQGIVVEKASRKLLNVQIRKAYADAMAALSRIATRDDYEQLSVKQVIDMISRNLDAVDTPEDLDYVMPVYNEYISLCRKTSTAQVYKYSLNNLKEYCREIDSLTFRQINGAWLRRYQNWLLDDRQMSVNGANVYLRNLRTVFNYAINNQFTKARYPFKDIDMSAIDPDKHDIPYEKFIEWATWPTPDRREFYRDLFMLSFYLCGIRPVDLLHVKKDQVREGRLIYWPEKLNGKTKLSVKIEPEAWEIIHKYEGKEYLLNVMESRTDYRQFSKHWNKAIRAIGEDEIVIKVGRRGTKYTAVKHTGRIPYITVYNARSCFASYLYRMGVPMDTISQALGHKSGLKVTNFYVKRDVEMVDKVNRDLIDRVTKDMAAYPQKKGWLE